MLLPSSLLWYSAANFCVLSILYNTDHLPVTRGIVLQNARRKQIFGEKTINRTKHACGPLSIEKSSAPGWHDVCFDFLGKEVNYRLCQNMNTDI
jgi:hypothetical protein